MNFSGCSFFSPEVSSLFFFVSVVVGVEREREERAGISPFCSFFSRLFVVVFFFFRPLLLFIRRGKEFFVSDKDFDVSREIFSSDGKGALLEFGSNFFCEFLRGTESHGKPDREHCKKISVRGFYPNAFSCGCPR